MIFPTGIAESTRFINESRRHSIGKLGIVLVRHALPRPALDGLQRERRAVRLRSLLSEMHLDSYAGAFEDYRRMVHANALRLGIGMPVDQSFEDQPPQ